MKKILLTILVIINSYILNAQKMIPYMEGEKIGFVNENLQILFSPQFDSIYYEGDYSSIVYKKDSDSLRGYIIRFDKTIINIPENSIGFVIGTDYYGFNYLDNDDKTVVFSFTGDEKYEFKKLYLYSSKNTDFIRVDHIGGHPRTNYINLKGELFLPPLNNMKINWFNKELKRGVSINSSGAYFIDSSGKAISNKKWGFIDSFFCGLALTDEGFIDYDENLIIRITRIPEMNINFSCGVIPIVINKQNNYELYSHEDCFGGNWAIINTSGEIIKANIDADSIQAFSIDGVAVIYKMRNAKLSYSIIDTQGNIITKDFYDKIYDSVGGYSRAKKNGKDYLINVKTGEDFECILFDY